MGIELVNLKKSYVRGDGKPVTVLDIPTLSVADCEAVCIAGGSGSGKTTLLNIIAGIVTPERGSVSVDGVDLTRLSESARDAFRARRIGYVFQTFNLLQAFTAVENVLMPMVFAGDGGSDSRARAHELLRRVGLADKADNRPRALSVGEQQRVAVARAIACGPKLILADEPTANLDAKTSRAALDLLREQADREGAALVVVTHDLAVRSLFKRVITIGEAA